MLAIRRRQERTERIIHDLTNRTVVPVSESDMLRVREQEHAIRFSRNDPAFELTEEQQRRIDTAPDSTTARELHFHFICLARDQILRREARDERLRERATKARMRAAEEREREAARRRHAEINWASDAELRLWQDSQWELEECEAHNSYDARLPGLNIAPVQMTADFMKRYAAEAHGLSCKAKRRIAAREEEMVATGNGNGGSRAKSRENLRPSSALVPGVSCDPKDRYRARLAVKRRRRRYRYNEKMRAVKAVDEAEWRQLRVARALGEAERVDIQLRALELQCPTPSLTP